MGFHRQKSFKRYVQDTLHRYFQLLAFPSAHTPSVYLFITVHKLFVKSQARPMDHHTLTEASEPHTEQEATYLWTLHHTSSLEETRSSSQVSPHGYFYPLDTVMATPFFWNNCVTYPSSYDLLQRAWCHTTATPWTRRRLY